MKKRKVLGNKNVVGANIERIRKERNISQQDFIAQIQVQGVDINPSSYSKLEGQTRYAYDYEIYAIAKILNIKLEDLFD